VAMAKLRLAVLVARVRPAPTASSRRRSRMARASRSTSTRRHGEAATDLADFGDMRLGEPQKRKVFETPADLEKVEEFAQLPDPQVKTDFQNAVTTKSEVFSIHVTTLFKRNEENRIYVLRRARAIVLRVEDGDGRIVPLVPFEERVGLRVQPIDIQEDNVDLTQVYGDLDSFAQEDRAWNPFLIDFYLPKHLREQFYQHR
jgi:hypothetical protein